MSIKLQAIPVHYLSAVEESFDGELMSLKHTGRSGFFTIAITHVPAIILMTFRNRAKQTRRWWGGCRPMRSHCTAATKIDLAMKIKDYPFVGLSMNRPAAISIRWHPREPAWTFLPIHRQELINTASASRPRAVSPLFLQTFHPRGRRMCCLDRKS